MATSATEVPAPKHHKSALGLEPSYEKQWDSVIQLQALQQKTPHRYQQSPVFSRKATSCPAEEFEHSRRHRHHHHHHRRHHHEQFRSHRRRGNSEGEKPSDQSDERVHLLSELPWRNSGDFSSSSSSNDSLEENSPLSQERFNIGSSPTNFSRKSEIRDRTRSASAAQPPLFLRRGKLRARSQDSSPLPQRKSYPQAAVIPQVQLGGQPPVVYYSGSLVLDIQTVTDSQISNALTPDEPDTPLAGSEGFLKVPTLDVTHKPLTSASSPHTLRKFLGLETDINHNEGLSEEEIAKSRLMCRRYSSSSESSTSTLT